MKKIVLTKEVNDSIDFLAQSAKLYYGAVNAGQTYQPHFDLISKAIVDDPDPCTLDEVKSP